MIKKLTSRHLLVALFLSLLGSLWVSSNLYTHTHNINDGQVTHSHPFAKGTDHSHTSAELATIWNLAQIVITAITLGFIIQLFSRFINNYINIVVMFKKHTLSGPKSLRGPPAFLA